MRSRPLLFNGACIGELHLSELHGRVDARKA